MSTRRLALRSAIIGAILGLVVLGVGGRALMRGVTLVTNSTPAYSLGGTIEILLAGVGFGALGGLILAGLPRHWGWWRGWVHAVVFLGAITLLSGASRRAFAALAQQARVPVFIAFALLVLVFSLLLARWERRPRTLTPDIR